MRSAILAAAAAIAAIPAVAAKGTTIVNNCDFTVYVFSVDADHNPQNPTATLSKGQSHSEDYRQVSQGGVSMKLSKKPLLWDFTTNTGPPITQLEYTLTGNQIWYDLSNVNCQTTSCPFQPYGMYLELADSSCPSVNCPAGQLTCKSAYTEWNDDWASLACPGSKVVDSTFYACGNSASGGSPAPSSSSSSKSAPSSTPSSSSKAAYTPPPSSTSSAPAATSKPALIQAENVDSNNKGAVFTTFVTQVVTIDARDASPTPVKRHEHHHRHAHPHHMQ